MNKSEWPELADETRKIWNDNAEAWDRRMGEMGNDFHRQLILPALDRLLHIKTGASVLDIGCGNGVVCRYLSKRGAQVTGIDASADLIDHARTYRDDVSYATLDATDEEALLGLGAKRFAAATATNVLMDMPSITPLMRALRSLLQPGGHFVFSLIHPCFQSPGATRVVEQVESDGSYSVRRSSKISHYIEPLHYKGFAVANSPSAQNYFHRPLHLLFAAAFEVGFVIDGLEEPTFPRSTQGGREFSWSEFDQIPPLLIARLRLVENSP
jgi:2-polyprenyl-3-methyl-5-hydroxy-6-metoxy-1,4-benzoquinol methylase